MTAFKPKKAYLIFAGLLLSISVTVACNNETSDKKEDVPATQQPVDTTKLDTATTRPVKTTN